MKVAEVKSLLPLADVYELRPDTRYLFVLRPEFVDMHNVANLLQGLKNEGVAGGVAIFVHGQGAVKIFDLEGTKDDRLGR